MNITEELKKNIADCSGLSVDGVVLEHPADPINGDYSTPSALVIGKRDGKNPRTVAEDLAEKLSSLAIPGIQKVEVAGPGFINFFLTRNFFAEKVEEIVKDGGRYGSNSLFSGQKIIVEYTDPNPFKEFHIGHLMPNVIGESIARLYEKSGALVSRACYQGDVGLHIAQTIAAILREEGMPGEESTLREKTAFLGRMYTQGSKLYDENEEFKEEVQRINKTIYSHDDATIDDIYKKGRQWSLENFERIYNILGTVFNYYFFESETAPIGKKIVEDNMGKVFEESQGAVVFKGEEFGLHTRVFINKGGIPTYEAKDLGLAFKKFELADWDKSLIVTASEQNDYFKVMFKALEQIDPRIALRNYHIGHGLLRFVDGKMSSRKGNVITGESLIEEMRVSALEHMKENSLTAEEKERVAQDIGVAAIKVTVLRQAVGKDIVFDPEKSISLEGDSGPYLQYTTVRAASVLGKANETERAVSAIPPELSYLERLLYRFPEVVERAAKESAPHHLISYLLEIAAAFNSWYATTKILDGGEFQSYRLSLTEATKIVLTNGLYLLGIRVPEKM